MKKKAEGRPLELPGAWGDLARDAGSLDALAEALGVNERTIRRWAHGEMDMSRMSAAAVGAYAKKRRVPWTPVSVVDTSKKNRA